MCPGFVCCAGLVGAGLPAMGQVRFSGSAQGCHRRQAGSHRYWVTARDLCAARALWELACQRWSSCGLSGSAQGCHRLPQVLGHSPGFVCCAGPCGSWLASDGAFAVCQVERRDVIAGKPAPTGIGSQPGICVLRGALWELACQRWSSCGLSGSAQGCHRLPQVLGHSLGFVCCAGLVGAGLPAMGQVRFSGSAQGCHRLPQVWGHSPGFVCCAGLVGAGLPAMGHLRSVR